MNNKDVNLLLANALESMKRVNIYSDEFSSYVSALEEDFEELGVDNVFSIVEFYVNLALVANYGGVSLIDVKGSNFQVGFADIQDLLEIVAESQGIEGLEVNLKTQLKLKNLREEYLGELEQEEIEEYLLEDATLVLKALGVDISNSDVKESVKDSLSNASIHSDEELVEQLKYSSKLTAIIKSTVDDILSVYDSSISMGYELETPLAMLVGDANLPTLVIGKDWRPRKMKSTASFFASKSIRNSIPSVKINVSERQINLEEIYTSTQPIYFPKKLAEFALATRVSMTEKEDIYSKIGKSVWRNNSKTGHWKADYSQREEIKKFLTEYAWEYACVVVNHLGYRDSSVFSKDRDVMMPDMAKQFTDAFTKYRNSLCTFSVLLSRTGDIEQWASAEWLVVAPSQCFVKDSLIVGDNFYTQVFNSSGSVDRPLVTNIKGIEIRSYRHIANEKVAEVEPLFAYKALELVQSRGETVSPKNIIVGKGLDGKLITSSMGVESALTMWKHLFHVTSSGSRSGKGVQITSQLTPTIATGRPAFLQDRKPDTMVTLYEMAGGSDENGTPYGYIVQGGVFSASNIASKNPNTVRELDWNNNPKIIGRKERLVPSWWGISAYEGIWGDMVYLRSMILTLGILSLRATVRNSDKGLYEQLGGDDGILVLYDEITNFTEQFLLQYLSSSNWFSKDVWSKKKSLNLKNAIRSLESAKEGSKAQLEAEDTIAEAKKDKFKFNVYIKDFIDNYNKTILILSEKEKAGFNQQESYFSDVYLVGQSLQMERPDTQTVKLTNTGEVAAFGAKENHLLGFLYNFQSDFIVGYNNTSGASHQAWRTIDGSDSKKYLTETARRFAYYTGVSFEDIRDGKRENVNRSKAVFSANESGAVYFKPYLILNSAEGIPVEQLEKVLGSHVESVKLNNAKVDKNGEIVYDSNGSPVWNEGIGLPEYIKRMSSTSNSVSDSFVKARAIAEMVIKRMGYRGDYLDFLMDLRPEWNFSAKDVVDAFTNESAYRSNERFSNWLEYNSILNGESAEESLVDYSDSVEDYGFEDAFISGVGIDESYESDLGYEDTVSTESHLDDNLSYFEVYDDEVDFEPNYIVDESTTDLSEFNSDEDLFNSESEDIVEEPRVYENLQGWQSRENEIPVSNEGISRLAEAFGVAPELIMQTYKGVDPNEEHSFNEFEEFNNQKTNEYVNNINYTFGGVGNGNKMDGLKDLVGFITKDVINQFGSLDNFETLVVKGGLLAVNNVVYKPTFKNLVTTNLPVDKSISLKNKQYADLYDFVSLKEMSNITVLSVDSSSFVLNRIARPLGFDEDDSLFKLFDILPSLRELKIGSNTFTREEAIENLTESESFLHSSRRRQQVINRADEAGRDFRRARWDSTKRYWSTASGWRRFTGVSTNLLGVGLGATTQLGAKTVNQTNSLVKSAGRLLSLMAKGVKDEFDKK